jgi:16S rRNA (guanine(527)-N(7))-methyltransferase RsmG
MARPESTDRVRFHVKHTETWLRCADWIGLDLAATAIERLEHYQNWLGSEAIPAGGLGPGESSRLHDRHIGDSLLFAGGFDFIPDRVLDVGSGVGLPGIPLAIVLGSTQFTLLDRSGRRVDLLGRVTRILELENVTVEQGEIEAYPKQEIALVSRATFPPDRARELLSPLLLPHGTAVIGGSWNQPPSSAGWNVIEIPPTVLDHTIWLLMMRRT